MLTGFKPKEKDLATPYLEELDGLLKLVGVTGKEALDMVEQSTDQIINRDGTTTGKINGRKLAALRIAACLRVRATGEPVYDKVDVVGENGDGNGALLEMDDSIFQQLANDVYAFMGKKPPSEIKKTSELTSNDSSTSLLQPDSEELLTNSSEASTVLS